MKIELEVITDIINTKTNKVVKKQDRIKKLFNIEEIEVEEYVEGKTGRHVQKYCGIYHKEAYYKINKPYEELKQLVTNKTMPVLGFAAKARRYNNA